MYYFKNKKNIVNVQIVCYLRIAVKLVKNKTGLFINMNVKFTKKLVKINLMQPIYLL